MNKEERDDGSTIMHKLRPIVIGVSIFGGISVSLISININYNKYIVQDTVETSSNIESDFGETNSDIITSSKNDYNANDESAAVEYKTGDFLLDVNDDSISGVFSFENQEIRYSYVAPYTGKYRFDFSSNDVECDYVVCFYTEDNSQIARSISSYDAGRTLELNAGKKYIISVKQKNGYPTFNIKIGIPAQVQEITENTFSGKIVYIDQEDQYTFVAPVSGLYRFDFIDSDVTCGFRFGIYASNNEKIALRKSIYDDGKTVELIGGENYRILIQQFTGFEDYTVNIGVPAVPMVIEGNIIDGHLSYIDQENIYYYHAIAEGNYTVWFDIDDVTSDYRIYVYEPNNNELIGSKYSNNVGKGRNISFKGNEDYRIVVKQYKGFPDYFIRIDEP